jgi:tetratricopeptide (TPR) repeat protein
VKLDGSEVDGIDTRLQKATASGRLFGTAEVVTIGRYIVLDRLGAGGMGVVYAARDPELDRKVALKLLHQGGWTEDTAGRNRLRREAKAMARLNHPNVATVHEVGEHEEMAYVAMEFVEGVTLRAWQAEPRSWREILDVYLQAARGLAAAHAVGLVHGDFKPDNAMLGTDDRVRVMDFGLARGPDAAQDSAPTLADDQPITRSSSVGGTPAYMAPEQFAGARGDAKVDQFAFCVALWEALTGLRPFHATSLAALIESVTAGRLPTAWPRHLPSWLRPVLARGLSPAPGARWPDMHALIAALAKDRTRRRRRLLAIGGAAVVGVSVVAGLQIDRWRRESACDEAAASIAEIWSEPVAAELLAGLVGTGAPGADAAFGRARPFVDTFVGSWRDVRHDQCMRATVDDTRDPALARASLDCLEQRRRALAGVLDVWRDPDSALVFRLVLTATSLPDPGLCGDDGYVMRRGAPPSDPAVIERVDELASRIEKARALETAGRLQDAWTAAKSTSADAQTVEWPPIRAQAMLEEGRIADKNGAAKEAETALREAFAIAHANGADETAADAALALTYALANKGELDEAARWSDVAHAAVERVRDGEGPLGGTWALIHGYVCQHRGDHECAAEHYQRAIRVREATYGPEHPSVAMAYQHLGMLEYLRERPAEARAAFERNLEINIALLGEDSPNVAHSRDALGTLLMESGQHDEALALLERARDARIRLFGADSVWVAHSLHNIGNVWLGKGEPRKALEHYERSAALIEKLRGLDHPDRVLGLSNIGLARSDLGEREQALAAFREALRIQEKALGPDHPETARVIAYLAGELVRAGDPAAALPLAERAAAAAEKTFGADHSRTVDARQIQGEALVELDRPREAIPILERALAADKAEVDPIDVGYTQFSLARALWNAGDDRARAVTLARAAEATFAATKRDTLTEIRTWLAEHAP